MQRISKSNVGISLDIGHAYLAANFYGFNFFDAIKLVKPLVKHVHVHDNFGKLSASYERSRTELLAVGRGDCHLPIGWGHIPITEVLATLQNYQGVFMQELHPKYYRYCREALAQAKNMAADIDWIESPEKILTSA